MIRDNSLRRSVLTIACALITTSAWAQTTQEGPVIYGRLDLSMDRFSENANSRTEQTNNASRVGFRGAHAIGPEMKILYGLESALPNDVLPFTQYRNAYVALDSSAGKFAIGLLDSANPTGSPLYSQITKHIPFVVHDAGATAIGTTVLNSRNRTPNSLGYMSPAFSGFDMRARYYQDEEPLLPTNKPAPIGARLRQFDIGLNYNQNAWGVGVGYGKDQKPGGFSNNDFTHKTHIVGSYDFQTFKLGATLGRDHYQNTATSRRTVQYYLLALSVPVSTQGNVVAHYMRRDVQRNLTSELVRYQMGYMHKLSKKTQTYIAWGRRDPNNTLNHNELRSTSLGIQVNF